MVRDDDYGAGADDLTFRWHDNLIYGLQFEVGEPEKRDWRSNLGARPDRSEIGLLDER
jgi:hypothetical protein